MKNFLFIIFTLILLTIAIYTFINGQEGIFSALILFVCGFLAGIFLMLLIVNVKDGKINLYKRELEKEAVASSENSSRVKVLEAKIEVLEKALENALKKNS